MYLVASLLLLNLVAFSASLINFYAALLPKANAIRYSSLCPFIAVLHLFVKKIIALTYKNNLRR